MAFEPILLTLCLLLLLSTVLSSLVHPANAVHLPPFDEPNTLFTQSTDRILLERAAVGETRIQPEMAVPTTTQRKKPKVVRLGIKHEEHYAGLGSIPSIFHGSNQPELSIAERKFQPNLQSNLKSPDPPRLDSRYYYKDQARALPMVYADDSIPRYPLARGRKLNPQDPSMQYRPQSSFYEYPLHRNNLAVRQFPMEQSYPSDPSYPTHYGRKSENQQSEYNYPSSYYTLPESHEQIFTTEPSYNHKEDEYYSSYPVHTYEQPQEDGYYAMSEHSYTPEEKNHQIYAEPHHIVKEPQLEEYSLGSLPKPQGELVQEAVCSCILYGTTGGECICPATEPIMYSLTSQPYDKRKTLTDMFREEHFNRHSSELWDANMDPIFPPEREFGSRENHFHKRRAETIIGSKGDAGRNSILDRKMGKRTMRTRNVHKSHVQPHEL